MLLLLVNPFEKFFDRGMYNYPDKFRIVNWNSFDKTCKNKRPIFTNSINFTSPFNRTSTLLLSVFADFAVSRKICAKSFSGSAAKGLLAATSTYDYFKQF